MEKSRHRASFSPCSLLCTFFVLFSLTAGLSPSRLMAAPQAKEGLTGAQVITEAVTRHSGFPWIYEEQTLVLRDNTGRKNVRKLRKFSRIESDQTVKLMMVFDFPREVRGMALTSVLDPSGGVENRIYLPGLGRTLLTGKGRGNQFLGTDFTIEDLVEFVNRYRYQRTPDRVIDKVAYFVVEAFDRNGEQSGGKIPNGSAYGKRRLFVRKDIFFIVRTDFFDRAGRMIKQLTRHDIKKTHQDMWQAGMLLMNNKRLNHSTLIKTDKRILSRDLVPAEIFTQAWLDTYRHLRPEHRPGPGEGKEDAAETNDTGN
ncbi:MAG: outer membrane lipoprotein-sorting protein [Desulfobacterales bacterium]|nr:outer membrane lipoprotein-sorting protein [Desulfobacterales bacterium]